MIPRLIFSLSLLVPLGLAKLYDTSRIVQLESTRELEPLLKTMDVWSRKGKLAQLRASEEELNMLEQASGGRLDFDTLVDNIPNLIQSSPPVENNNGDWFSSYHTYSSIVSWYSGLEHEYPEFVRFEQEIGRSFEGRKIAAVHITSPSRNTKKKVWFQSLIHAREWITGPTVQYIVQHLLHNINEPKIIDLLDKVELIVIPIVNPDGYEYTWNHDRLWRKNRHRVPGGIGIDLNRNFPSGWGKAKGASIRAGAETYQGTGPASEPETQTIIDYFNRNYPIAGAIDFHSYSHLILRPFGTTTEDAPDEMKLSELGQAMANIIKRVNGESYISEKTIDLYPASGTASDWFYSNGHRTYAYTIELSPHSKDRRTGFMLPASEIRKVGEDILPAALYFMHKVASDPL